MNLNRWLLSFDVRVHRDQYVHRRWNSGTRAAHLLRADIEWPMSVDRWVWPSVFVSPGANDLRDCGSGAIAVDPLTDAGDYWKDLGRMQAHYRAHSTSVSLGVGIAIELLSEKPAEGSVIYYELPGGIRCGMSVEPVVPPRPPDASALLGYDVATAGQFSGLSDFEYTDEERASLGPVWAPRLNEHGLFVEIDDAVAFREITEARLPGEGPFWVYALWRLPDP